jgi:hypothetical protein
MNRWKMAAALVVGSLVVGTLAVPVRAEDNAVIKGKVLFKQ